MGKTIVLEDIFNEFVLAGRFPRDRGGVASDVVAAAIASWRPGLAHLFTSKRVAYLMGHHPWIDRIRMSLRHESVQRYSYVLADDAIDVINEIVAARRAPTTGL